MIATMVHTHRASCVLADGPWCLLALLVVLAIMALLQWRSECQHRGTVEYLTYDAVAWARSLPDHALWTFVNHDWSSLDGEEKDAIYAEWFRRGCPRRVAPESGS